MSLDDSALAPRQSQSRSILSKRLIIEATEVQHLLAAAETTLILHLTVWKLPTMIRNWGQWRWNAHLVF